MVIYQKTRKLTQKDIIHKYLDPLLKYNNALISVPSESKDISTENKGKVNL